MGGPRAYVSSEKSHTSSKSQVQEIDRLNSTAKRFISIFFMLLLGVALFGETVVGSYGPLPAFAQTDTTDPTVSSVAITSDPDENDADLGAYITGRSGGMYVQSTRWASGVYRIGDDVEVTVTFSESVTVTGSPQLELAIGPNSRTAVYDSTTDSKVIFSYTVAEGDWDTDGIAINANKLTLNGGGIKDTANNAAELSHNAQAAQSGHKVDGVRPRLKLTASDKLNFLASTGGSDGAYTTGELLIVRAKFSEDPVRGSVAGPPRVTMNFDGGTRVAKWDPSLHFGSNRDLGFFSYVIQKGDLASAGPTINANAIGLAGGFIRDAAGNDAILTHAAVGASTTFKVDAVAPTISSIAITSDPGDDDTYQDGDTVEVTVTFSESMSIPSSITCSPDVIHCKAELELNIGGVAKKAAYKSHQGTKVIFAYDVRSGDTDANGISIGANKVTGYAIRDAAGQGGAGINDADLRHSALTDNAGHKVGVTSQPARSTDATLSALTLSGVNFGTFASGTASYTADVASSVTETTVTPTVNHSGASHVIKLDGVTDADGVIPLVAGSNVITVEVTAEDGTTTLTYTVTVTRLVSQQQTSADATLSALSLSGVNFGTFASGTGSYTASVAYSVTQTTITPTVNDSNATYAIKLGGVTDADGIVSLAVGSNVITVEVTAEDEQTTKIYTVTVTRAAASTDATLEWLALSGIDIGNGLGHREYPQTQTSFTASVYNSVSQTTVAAAPNHSAASYVVKLGSATDADGVIALGVGSNVITVEVTAEDGQTTKSYTATVNRATASAPTTGELATDDPQVNFHTISYTHSFVALTFSFPRNRGIIGVVTQRYKHDGDNFVSAGSDGRYEETFDDDLGGLNLSWTYTEPEPNTVYRWVAKMLNSQSATVIETSLEVRTPPEPGTTTLSSDATLSDLTLSGVDFEAADRTFVGEGFHNTVTSYVGSAANSVTQTTVTPTVNHSGASYVIKLGGVTDADGAILLAVGSNVITIEVTAENGETTRTYTVTVTRASPPSTDATLSGLTLSGVNFGTFSSDTTSYTASVASSVTQTTVTPRVNHSGANYVIKLGSVTDSDGVISLAEGDNVITIEVTAEDGRTTRTYTVTVTHLVSLQQKSADATLSALTLSGIDFGTFRSGTTSYNAHVANSVTQTTVTPTVNDSDASYVIKLGGVTDSDGTVSLAVGSNVITVEVMAEDEQTTRTYTVTVTRASPPSTDATLNALALSGINFGTFSSGTTSYSAQVANSVSRTTVAPTVNHSGASYVIKRGGAIDADGVIVLSVGANVITVEVTAQDGNTTRTYTVTVTRAEPDTRSPLSSDATLSALSLGGIDFGTFDSTTTSYTARVANNVTETTVIATTNHSAASYAVQLGGVTDEDGVVALSVGSNVITINVTAEDDASTETYTVTVTRDAPLSTDATLHALTLSAIDFGIFDPATTDYAADVPNDVSQTTVTPTVNNSGAGYVINLAGVEVTDGEVSLEVGENIVTVEVTAEDGETTLTYRVTITREEPHLLLGGLPSDDPPVNFRITGYGEDEVTLEWEIPHNRGITGYMLERYDHDGTEFSLSDRSISGEAAGGSSVSESSTDLAADTRYRYDLALRSDDGTVIIEKSLEVRTLEAGTAVPVADASLSALSLSGVELSPAFISSTYRYTASVANDITQTAVTATLNDASASYAVNLGGTVDDDAVLDLTPGSNVITVHVTAADDVTARVYTVIVNREKAANELSDDAFLRALFLSEVDFGMFDRDNTAYSAEVANDVLQTTVTSVRRDVEATHVVKLGSVESTDGIVEFGVGENIITIEVTAEDGETTRTYTVTVTRAEAPAPEPGDTCVQSVDADGTTEGFWDDTCLSEKDAPGGAGDRYARFFTFTLTEATDVVISLNSEEDTYLYLLDGHGKDGDTLHSNDDILSGGVNLNSRLYVTLQPGDYTIEATTYYAEREGDFTLTIEGLGEAEEPAPQPDPEPEPEVDGCVESVTADGTIEGSWDSTCLSDRAALSGTGDRYSRLYTFTLDQAADVTVTLESDEDTYLYLLEGHGRSDTVLQEEDDIDYPSNTNSRLAETLQAGDYTIEATTYYADKSGEFTLTISGLDSTQ